MTAEGPALRATPEDRRVRPTLPPEATGEPALAPSPVPRAVSLATLGDARRRLDRRHLGLAIGLLVAAWLVLVFSRAVAEAADVNEDAAAVRAEIADLRTRLEEARREVALIQSDPFLRHRARAYGMGETGERLFSLEPGAPPPRAVIPLGAAPEKPPSTPLEDWLELLFGT